jgi:hypothetical protein
MIHGVSLVLLGQLPRGLRSGIPPCYRYACFYFFTFLQNMPYFIFVKDLNNIIRADLGLKP